MFASLAEIALFSNFWFWLVFGIFVIVSLISSATDTWGISIIALVAFLGLLYWAFGVPLVKFVIQNPGLTCFIIFGYFVIGVVYCFFKWFLFVKKSARKYREIRETFFKKCNIAGDIVPDEFKDKLTSHVKTAYGYALYENSDIIPVPSNHKEQIIHWIGYWPFSFIVTMIDDPFRRLANGIYELVADSLKNIAEYAFKDFKAEIREHK